MAGNEESQISARKYPEEEVEHICQLLPGHGFLGDKIKTNRYTSKDIKDVADQLEAKHLQQTTGTADPKPRTLVNLNRKERNAGLRIDLQGVIQVGSEKYEQLAIQTNDNQKSSTLAQIHIQACTKVKIDSEVVREALHESFTAKIIVQISERLLSPCGSSVTPSSTRTEDLLVASNVRSTGRSSHCSTGASTHGSTGRSNDGSTGKRSLGDTPTSVAPSKFPRRIANGDSRKRKAPEDTQMAASKKAKVENSPPPHIEMSAEQFKQTGYGLLGKAKSPT